MAPERTKPIAESMSGAKIFAKNFLLIIGLALICRFVLVQGTGEKCADCNKKNASTSLNTTHSNISSPGIQPVSITPKLNKQPQTRTNGAALIREARMSGFSPQGKTMGDRSNLDVELFQVDDLQTAAGEHGKYMMVKKKPKKKKYKKIKMEVYKPKMKYKKIKMKVPVKKMKKKKVKGYMVKKKHHY